MTDYSANQVGEFQQPDYNGGLEMSESKEKKDPWAHRSESMSCKTCMWFVEKVGSKERKLGRCRKHAPTMSGYPAVFTNDWCGDHKVDENKL